MPAVVQRHERDRPLAAATYGQYIYTHLETINYQVDSQMLYTDYICEIKKFHDKKRFYKFSLSLIRKVHLYPILMSFTLKNDIKISEISVFFEKKNCISSLVYNISIFSSV